MERLIYQITGEDAKATAELMKQLSTDGRYSITKEMQERLASFYGGYASEEETAKRIKASYENTGYVLDTHTAVASSVYEKYKEETKDETKTVIASTASPFKFTRSVMNAIDAKYDSMDDFALVDELSRIANVAVPPAIEEIRTAPVIHQNICEKEQMADMVVKFLNIK